MGIVHVAIYDAAVALEGGYRPYVPTPAAPAEHLSRGRDRDRSVRHAHRPAAAAWRRPDHPRRRLRRLSGCYPRRYARWRERPSGMGSRIGSRSRRRSSRCAANDGRERNPVLADLGPPAPGPGVWQPAPGAVLGLRLPGMKPLALTSASQSPARRPDSPDQPGGTRRTLTRSRSSVASTAPRGRRSRRARPCSGPTTTSGSGTTACSASPPRAGSTSRGRRGCWRWHTWPGAMR
jgi:hypothetical protein